jgi:hypothetical protein
MNQAVFLPKNGLKSRAYSQVRDGRQDVAEAEYVDIYE